MLEVTGIEKRYRGRTILKNVSFRANPGECIGIVGGNGCGKTTLLKMIMGELRPDQGCIEIGETVHIGYYAQEAKDMDPAQRVIDYIKDTAEYIRTEDGYISASQMLEKFLFV